ncbi:hypothetical protein CRG98_003477, partial [Punica granatum]
MNWAKLSNVSTAIKSTVNHKLSFKSNPTITLSILESGLLRCRTPKQFNQILSQMILTGYLKDAYAASRLLKFSIESSFVPVDYSLQIFTRLENSNGFTWNTMMRALVQRKNSPQDAILLYKSMLNENVGPDNYTYPILIQAAALLVAHFEGKQIGDVEEAKRVFDRMPQRNTIASNSMIVLFGKTGRVGDAFDLFNELDEKDMVSWSAIISCYEQNRMYEDALGMFKRMCAGGIELDEVVLEVSEAQKLFDVGHHNLDLISWNSMISGYIRSGLLERAEALFYSMPEKDLISWSAMISGYAQHDQFSKTLELFQEMQLSGIRPDETILVSVISACTHLGALDLGRWVHAYISKNGLNVNVILGTTLLDMYMKCGCVESAMDVFCKMEERGVSTWNAAILGLAMNGLTERSLDLLSEMKSSGVKPNEITFMAVLGACRHMGLVDEGRSHFDSMVREFKVEPNVKHYGCMVDLLGRA